MDESALRRALANLADCSSSQHWWLGFWTTLVVVGVAFEIIFVVWEYIEDRRDCRRNLLNPPVTPNLPLFILGFLGAALVTAGVAGELFVESKIATAETCIRKGNDQLSLLLSTEANDAATSARTAHEEAEAAKSTADQAQETANAVGVRAEQLNGELASEEAKLNAVDAKRAELETSLRNLAVCTAPRVIPNWGIGKTETSADPLKAFAGRKAVIEVVPNDAESYRAAGNIAAVLSAAGWQVIPRTPTYDVRDGVEVQPFLPSPKPGDPASSLITDWQSETRSQEIAGALVDFLHSYNWEAKLGWPEERGQQPIPPDGIRVRVGLYPAIMYVSPPAMKDWTKLGQKTNEMRIKSENDLFRRSEEFLKRLPPEQAKRLKASEDEWKKEEKRWRERYSSGPCQPLESLFPSF